MEDTGCYRKIVQNIQTLCERKEFSLIECLTSQVDKVIRETLGRKTQEFSSIIKITTQKMAPPILGIHEGASFIYCNEVK